MKKILVVDDDAVIQRLLGETLGREGFEVISAKDGLDAMDMVRSQRPDLVVLDIMMPNLNGYDVCRNIKFDPELKHIPVIFLTTCAQEVNKGILALMGVGYLHKTCKPQELLEKIKKILG